MLPSHLTTWHVGILDGSKGNLVGAFGFQWAERGNQDRHAYTLSAAYPTKHLWVGSSITAYDYQGLTAGNGWHFSGSTGVLGMAGPLVVGVYAKHMLDQERDHLVTPFLSGGIAYTQPKVLRLLVETSRNFKISDQGWNLSSATELFLHPSFTLGGGYYWDRSNAESYWSVLATLVGPKADLRYAFTQTTKKNKIGSSFDLVLKF
jgi:hypothetical protein